MKRLFAAVVFSVLAAASLTVSAQRGRPDPATGIGAAGPTYPQRAAQTQGTVYFPERFDWQHRKPEEVGMDPALIAQAGKGSIAKENPGRKKRTPFLKGSLGREPFDTLIGPVKDRGGAAGVITRHGYVVAEWGDPRRADITNSVPQTFLTTVVG